MLGEHRPSRQAAHRYFHNGLWKCEDMQRLGLSHLLRRHQDHGR